MATTTKSTRAKSKTTKSKTATTKTTSKAKTSSAKTAAATKSKKVTKPAVAVKVAKPKKVRAVTLLTLRRIHIAALVLFLGLAVAAAFVMNESSFQLTIGHLARNDIMSTENTVFSSAVRAVYDVQLRYLVVATMLLSAVGPALYISKLEKRYSQYLQTTRLQPYRWVDFALTGALMTETVALLSGVNDIMVLKLVGGSVIVSAMLGLIAERQNNAAAKPVWSAYLTSLFSGVLPWFLIATSAVATVVYGNVRAPWYVYAAYAAVAGGFVLVARNEYAQYKRGQNYLAVERNYQMISLLSKVAFAAVLIAGLR